MTLHLLVDTLYWFSMCTSCEEEMEYSCLSHDIHCACCQLFCWRRVAGFGSWPDQRWPKDCGQVMKRHFILMLHLVYSKKKKKEKEQINNQYQK